MDARELEGLLKAVSAGELSCQHAFERLKTLTYTDLEFAKVDSFRSARQGFPEVIFGPGKTAPQIIKIAEALLAHQKIVIATKVEAAVAEQVLSLLPDGRYEPRARMLIFGDDKRSEKHSDDSASTSLVSVVTAGTADLPVAEEAALYLVASGCRVNQVFDVGVAGIHRLLPRVEEFNKSDAVIVVAGMDGALASVLGGLIAVPIIAVPTSVGYGASFQGLSALLAMLSSCAAGLTVVNIDNGFGAAMAALRITNLKIKGKVLDSSAGSSTDIG